MFEGGGTAPGSGKRIDFADRLSVPRATPAFAKFVLVKRRPFDYETLSARRQASSR